MSARYRCQVCGGSLTINKSAGRTRLYCSDRCRDRRRRNANFEISGRARYPRQGMPRNSGKTLTKTTPKSATLAGRASSISGPIEVFGGRYSWCRPTIAQARLIANAVAAELGNYVLPSPSREGGAS
jgi:hypothetical protein